MAKQAGMRFNNRIGLVVLLALALTVLLFLLYTGRDGRAEYVEETIKISELLAAAVQLAEAGGDKIVEIRKMDDAQIGQLSKGHTKEGRDEYVTLGDQLSHQIITSGFKALWQNLRFRSEEKDPANLHSFSKIDLSNPEILSVARRDEAVTLDQVAVWIDPLDATQEYTEGASDPSLLKFVTVMICVAVEGKPIAGVIHEPFTEDPRTGIAGVTKWAWVGHGISNSLKTEIESSDHPRSENTRNGEKGTVRVIASRSHAGDVFKVAESAFGRRGGRVEEIVAAGSGYKALQVAENKADLYLHTTAIKKWDICAGDAVLRAIGGRMTTLRGQEVNYSLKGNPKNSDGIVAAATESEHARYLEKLRL